MASKNYPREVRFFISKDMHLWIKASATKRGLSIQSFVRDLFSDAIERDEFKERYGISNQLIQEVAKKVVAEMPKRQPDSEGEIH